MAQNTIIPALADISQDIAGSIPLELILTWNTGSRSKKRHTEVLSTYKRQGIIVSSDASGLSKLTGERSLLEVMWLVSQPKTVIYQYGKAIAGKPIGIWSADNTQMFYDETIKAEVVIAQMVAAQREIKKLPVQVGIGIHLGTCWEIGGGLYGSEAESIEHLTENETQAGDIIVTQQLLKKLDQSHQFAWEPFAQTQAVRILSGTAKTVSKHPDQKYPYPFNDAFYEVLQQFIENAISEKEILQKFNQETHVILVKIQHAQESLLLDALTRRVLANTYISKILKEFPVQKVKSNGEVGIFVSRDPKVAIAFAQAVGSELKTAEFAVNVGISFGSILLFDMGNGEFEIAGGPVNIASKLAEDAGISDSIIVHDSVKDLNTSSWEKCAFTISKIQLKGWKKEI